MSVNYAIESRTLSPGTPKWVTAELLTDTLETWQPHYAEELTDTDLLEILLSMSRLFDALQNHVLPETES